MLTRRWTLAPNTKCGVEDDEHDDEQDDNIEYDDDDNDHDDGEHDNNEIHDIRTSCNILQHSIASSIC